VLSFGDELGLGPRLTGFLLGSNYQSIYLVRPRISAEIENISDDALLKYERATRLTDRHQSLDDMRRAGLVRVGEVLPSA